MSPASSHGTVDFWSVRHYLLSRDDAANHHAGWSKSGISVRQGRALPQAVFASALYRMRTEAREAYEMDRVRAVFIGP